MTRTCDVSGPDCVAPAGYQIGGLGGPIAVNDVNPTRATCFACGQPVCTSCSRRVIWYRHGRRRVCDDCREEVAVDPDDE